MLWTDTHFTLLKPHTHTHAHTLEHHHSHQSNNMSRNYRKYISVTPNKRWIFGKLHTLEDEDARLQTRVKRSAKFVS